MNKSTIKIPTKHERQLALDSFNKLQTTLKGLTSEIAEIEIEETQEKIKIPLEALQLFAEILDAMGQGKPISIVPLATEMTTQAAAEFLGCSRPHLVKLLEQGEIAFTKVGRHRRVRYDDLSNYKIAMKEKQLNALRQLMKSDEDSGLYDS